MKSETVADPKYGAHQEACAFSNSRSVNDDPEGIYPRCTLVYTRVQLGHTNTIMHYGCSSIGFVQFFTQRYLFIENSGPAPQPAHKSSLIVIPGPG